MKSKSTYTNNTYYNHSRFLRRLAYLLCVSRTFLAYGAISFFHVFLGKPRHRLCCTTPSRWILYKNLSAPPGSTMFFRAEFIRLEMKYERTLFHLPSELLGQFRLIGDRASDVPGGRICLTQNAYAEI